MTTIYCSGKLADFLGKEKLSTPPEVNEAQFGNWNGHLFYYQRKKYLMFVNSKTYYAVLIPPIKKADLKNLENIFLQRLLEQLVFDKIIYEDSSLVILSRLLPLTFSKTNNDKKAIGTLNEFIFQFKGQLEYSDEDQPDLPVLNSRLNQIPVGAGRSGKRAYGWPIEDMKAMVNL
ncbi:DUF6933 domain-containing protein [Desertivirga brevis]|uniref:DUF6933 domain-containing protein n=1 Tax=Desertivirga brevis TaxID=2810310 RepID=UPI001A977450|nr:hypothetical protein [Pedobacter sp. SYSU D00873]